MLLKSRCDPIVVTEHPAVLKTLLQYVYAEHADIPSRLSLGVYVSATRHGLMGLAALAEKRFIGGLCKDNIYRALDAVDDIPALRDGCVHFLVNHPSMLTNLRELSKEQLTLLVSLFASRMLK